MKPSQWRQKENGTETENRRGLGVRRRVQGEGEKETEKEEKEEKETEEEEEGPQGGLEREGLVGIELLHRFLAIEVYLITTKK